MARHENCFQLRTSRIVALTTAAMFVLTPLVARAADDSTEQARVKASGEVLTELINSPSGIPHSVLNKSECIIILPSVKKAGFIVGAQYGRGIMSCRSGEKFDGPWSAPILMQSSGGSFGLQAGGEATDYVILVMNDKGGDASIAAGPVGRSAEASTNAAMSAEMLSYSRAHGVFGGVSLSGSNLAPDGGANEKLYGKKVSGTEIFSGAVPAPPVAADLLATLQSKSPGNASKGK